MCLMKTRLRKVIVLIACLFPFVTHAEREPIPSEFQVNTYSQPITGWLFVGPFPNGRDTGFDTVFAPEVEASPTFNRFYTGKDGEVIQWRKIATGPTTIASTYVLMGNDQEQSVSYFWTMIDAPRRQPINLGIGADDGVKIWLNGSLIYANKTGYGVTTEEDGAWGTLQPGPNQLLVKLINVGGICGLAVTMKCEGVTLSLPTVP